MIFNLKTKYGWCSECCSEEREGEFYEAFRRWHFSYANQSQNEEQSSNNADAVLRIYRFTDFTD